MDKVVNTVLFKTFHKSLDEFFFTDHGNSWAMANTTKILPNMCIDIGHYQLSSPEYTDSHGPALPIGESANRTMRDWWTMALAGQAEYVAHKTLKRT